MVSFSYSKARAILRTVPICPKPKSVGLENIPKEGPIIFVYNHLTRRGEPVYLGMAAPSKPNLRFLAENIITSPEYSIELYKEVEDAIFTQDYQEKLKKRRFTRYLYHKLIDFLTRFAIAQSNKLAVIVVNLQEPTNTEEKIKKIKTNKQAFLECIKSLEKDIPLAIAPSGGKTSDTVENPVYQTIVPTLASSLYKKGKVVKIVPSVIKEDPLIDKKTYWQYVADRIFFYKLIKRLKNFMKKKKYEKPKLIVEFLPALTFETATPTKPEKIDFVKNLQQMIYDALKV